MRLVTTLAAGLLAWSLLANLLLGEQLYVVRNLVLTVVLLAVARRCGVTWSGLGLHPDRWRGGMWWGMGAVAVVAVVVALGLLVSERVSAVGVLLSDERAALPAPELLYQALVRIPLGTAVFEEVAFRGVLLGALLRVTGRWSAVAWSSVVFGLWHVAPTIVTLEMNQVAPGSAEGLLAVLGAVVVTTVAGVLFSALRLRSASLLAPVLAHWATNSLGLLAAASVQAT
jgi:uncharacterized protein